jgi:transposase
MWIKRTETKPNGKEYVYLQLIQSYRDKNGKSKHRVILNLGKEQDVLDSSVVDDIIKGLEKLSKELIIIEKSEFKGNTKILGPILAVEAIWKKLKLKKNIDDIQNKYKIQFNLNESVKLMVINRLVDPKSKLAIETWKDKIHFDSNNIKLQHLYKSLDILADNKESLEESLYSTSMSLFKPEIKVVFYDLTTTYFESQAQDELRRFGYSKDNKTDCTQVVIGLIISKDGIPLGYEVFPGNTYEGHTVSAMLDKLHIRYKIGKLVFVGDRGLLSKKVLQEIEAAGYEYIVAAKLKSVPKEYHERILDRSQYRKIGDELWLSELEIDGKRLIVGYNGERAKRDKAQRDEILKKLTKNLKGDSANSLINVNYSRFLTIGKSSAKIDDSKVAEIARWDGFFGYHTNNKELTQEETLDSYRLLWQVEDSFRHLKSTLNMRPMFHWTEKRINGHIMMCFLSFYILKIMDRKITESGLEISVQQALDELSEIRTIEIKTKNKLYIARTEISGQKIKILRALSCKIPKTILQENVVV